jgi:hypothetical protein
MIFVVYDGSWFTSIVLDPCDIFGVDRCGGLLAMLPPDNQVCSVIF